MPVALKLYFFFFIYIITLPATNAQYQLNNTQMEQPVNYSVKTIYYPLGTGKILIKLTQYGEKENLVFISLHDDETTSVEATKGILEREGGLMIEIENKEKRDLKFKLGNIFYQVDPNRIFSLDGAAAALKENGRFNQIAAREVENWGNGSYC